MGTAIAVRTDFSSQKLHLRKPVLSAQELRVGKQEVQFTSAGCLNYPCRTPKSTVIESGFRFCA